MKETLLFDTTSWLVWAAPFAGVFAATFSKRHDPRVDGDRVLRHDLVAIIEHWTHGLSTAVLLVTGVLLGFLFMPALVGSGQPVWTLMNIHFWSVIVFLFGTFYYGANTLLATRRLREHLPTKDAIEFTKRHYGLLLGFKQFTMPPERKYFESEKMAYLMAAAATITSILSGFVKLAAHVVDVPNFMLALATPAHDLATVVMIAFILPHIFFAALLPDSWPIFRSMLTGYVSLEYARHEHAGWIAELREDQAQPEPGPASEPTEARPAA